MQINKPWIIGGLVLWLVLLFILIAQFFYFASHPLAPLEAGNHVEIPSPSGIFIVAVFNVYGDATSADFTQISIRERGERFDLWKNNYLFSIEGIKKTKVEWASNSKLQIQYESGTVHRDLMQWKDIHISYSELK